MRILTNETTMRGVIAISEVLSELVTRGNDVTLLLTPHPSDGLKYTPPFMADDNADVYEYASSICNTIVVDEFRSDPLMRSIYNISPDIYITKGDNRMPRDYYISTLCRSMGIPILGLQADSHIYINPGWFSKCFLVSGNYWSRYLNTMGASNVVVGSIKADYVYNNHRKDGIVRSIVFFDQMTYSRSDRDSILDTLRRLSDKSGLPYYIKLHPAWTEYHVELSDMWGDTSNIVYSNQYDMMGNSLVIAAYSNTIYESYYAGSKVIVLNISEHKELYRECGVDIYSIDDLYSTTLDILDDKYDLDKLSDWMRDHYYCDGKSSRRICDYVESYNE